MSPERAPSQLRSALGRLGVRLLAVNLVVVLVPVAGLELARLYERQLLGALERDMRDQAVLVGALLEQDLRAGVALDAKAHGEVLVEAAKRTRMRVRVLDEKGAVVVDSHAGGPPEGPEPKAPRVLPASRADVASVGRYASGSHEPPAWPELAARVEVRAALAGRPASRTRVREADPEVLLFVAEPIRAGAAVVGATYVVRSTQPVLVELYRIRSGLLRVLAAAFALTGLVTAALALSISRPLARLARAARRVASGERDVDIPISGGGEIEELATAFARMKAKLDARLRYIEGFAADVAHELKSPLTSIRGAAELLGEGAADDPEARARFLRNIELDVVRLDRLASRLLELSRIEASVEPMAPVDLGVVLARVVERVDTKERPVRLRLDGPLDGVRGREHELATALLNLCENAARFSPEGVPVEVVAACEGADVAVSVTDRGPGIPEQNLARVFDRFFTTDAHRDGTGLGLAIVKSVAEAHGGSITVTSRPGEGACFRLALPVAAG